MKPQAPRAGEFESEARGDTGLVGGAESEPRRVADTAARRVRHGFFLINPSGESVGVTSLG